MFDFLSEETEGQSARRSAARRSERKVMPVIRRPVPIAKSGPLLPPKPGDPVEPPPPLTTGMPVEVAAVSGKKAKISDDLDFLDETCAQIPDLRPPSRSNARANNPENLQSLQETNVNSEQQTLEQEFQDLSADPAIKEEFEFETDWRSGHETYDDEPEEGSAGWLRWALLASSVVVLAGGGFYTYSSGLLSGTTASDATLTQSDDTGTVVVSEASTSDSFRLPGADSPDGLSDTTEPVISTVAGESSLAVRFRTQLASIESMVQSGSLQQARQQLSNMDRSVYGYGAAEFSALESQIGDLESAQSSQSVNAAIIERERIERLRLANEAALLADQAQQAARAAEVVETAKLEEARILAENIRLEAASIEAENIRAEEARVIAESIRLEEIRAAAVAARSEENRIEAARIAARDAEQAARARIDEAATAEVVRLEQLRSLQARELETAKLLEAQRLEELAARQQAQSTAAVAANDVAKSRSDTADTAVRGEARDQVASADRAATDRQIAQERIATDRRAAKEARFARVREIEAEIAAAKAGTQAQDSVAGSQADLRGQQVTNGQNRVQTPTSQNSAQTSGVAQVRPITDDELQTVYRRFTDLQDAISERDITALVNLTERSGLRVQQFMQVFENSAAIDVRIRNVSTSNASGEINGTLQIRSIERNDGTLAAPPANLKSIKVTTKREGDGWSVIRW